MTRYEFESKEMMHSVCVPEYVCILHICKQICTYGVSPREAVSHGGKCFGLKGAQITITPKESSNAV